MGKNRWLVAAVLFVGLLALLSGAVWAAGGRGPIEQPFYGQTSAEPSFAPDRIVVTFQPWVSDEAARAIHATLRARLIERGYGNAFDVVQVPAAAMDRVLAAYQRRPEVLEAEPDGIATALAFPNDPYFYPYQWNFYDHGVRSNGIPSYYGVEAQTAWGTTSGATVTVAIVDTGIAYEDYGVYRLAPDLAGTSFVPGYNFVNNTTHANDNNGHGTHVSGTVAQTTNNARGVAGIAFSARLMPVKVLDRSGSGYYSWIASGIRFAADHGATVINLSLGGSADLSVLRDAVTYAYNKGITIVAAAGNSASSVVDYPAAYSTQVIAVGATRFDGRLAPYSDFGPKVDLLAPGGDMTVDQNRDGHGDGIVQQTFQGSPLSFGYYLFQGTSMATPHVSAAAALVRSSHPGYGRDQVRAALEDTAVPLGSTGRLVDAAAAVQH